MKKCNSCNTENKDQSTFCVNCGAKLSPAVSVDPTLNGRPPKRGPSGFKIFMIILVIFMCLIILGLACLYFLTDIFNPADSRVIEIEEIPKAVLSEEQERLIAMFGYPDEFVIALDKNGEVKRVETWIYSEMEGYFIFQDGIYIEGERLVTPDLKEDRMELRPQDFNFSMTPGHIDQLVGFKGVEAVDSVTGFTIISYGDGELVCSFDDSGELVAVNRARLVVD